MTFQPNSFNTGLCEFDCGTCCEACMCPWYQTVVQCSIAKNDPPGGCACCYCLALMFCDGIFCGGCSLKYNLETRSHFVRKYEITNETSCGSACTVLFCMCCSIAQVHREMCLRHQFPGGICLSTPYTKPGCVAPLPQQMPGPIVQGQAVYLVNPPPVHPAPYLPQPAVQGLYLPQPAVHQTHPALLAEHIRQLQQFADQRIACDLYPPEQRPQMLKELLDRQALFYNQVQPQYTPQQIQQMQQLAQDFYNARLQLQPQQANAGQPVFPPQLQVAAQHPNVVV